ncbi:GumC family protein [Tunturiibacter gelidiferens]|uniref:GumC family protein n=1 Tax=Tunturiibacter gelidiferens TaxID=3069689 RepID=UPI003D9B91D6
MDGPLASDEEENSIDLASLLNSLYEGRRTILVTTVAVFAIATSAAFLIPPRYTSKGSFIPPTTNSSSTASALAGQLSQLSGLGAGSLMGGIKSPSDLYVGILKSRSVGSKLVKRFDLKSVYRVKKESEAEKRLASNSDFDIGIKDSIVTISVTDKSPARAQDMTNAYLDVLRETNGRLALSESSQRRLFFGQQLAKEKDDLADAEVELKKTQETSGLIAPVGQSASEIQIIAETRAQIAMRQVELSALRQSATEQNPQLIRLQSEIADLEGQLSRLQTGSGKSGGGAIPTAKFPALALDYVRKSREVKYHEVLFEMLSRQYEAARIDEAREAPLLQVLDIASYPDAKSFPPRMLMMLGGLILGCLAGSGWVLLHERFAAFFASLRSGKNA